MEKIDTGENEERRKWRKQRKWRKEKMENGVIGEWRKWRIDKSHSHCRKLKILREINFEDS